MSGNTKRSIVINKHKTSISLEDEFWDELKNIAARKASTIKELVGQIDEDREGGNLSSALRLYVLDDAMTRAGEKRRAAA